MIVFILQFVGLGYSVCWFVGLFTELDACGGLFSCGWFVCIL